MAEFTWNVDANPVNTKRPRVSNIQFGDGYSQRVIHGLNTNAQAWDVSFANREETEANEIDDFLTDLNGVDYFTWTPPGKTSSLKFICQEWTIVPGKGNYFSLSARFLQVFDP